MTLRLSPGYLAAFLCLTILCGTSHEFAHHFSGALLVGHFGYKTFNSFQLHPSAAQHPWSILSELGGPALTYGLMWAGWRLLRREDAASKQMGFALVFANFPVNRLLFVLLNMNDEQYFASQVFGSSRLVTWITIAAVWLVALPPVVEGFRQIRNRRRVLWFLGFFILPFVFVVLFAGFFLEEFVLLKHHVLAGTVIGIPWLILLTEALVLLGYWRFRPHLAAA